MSLKFSYQETPVNHKERTTFNPNKATVKRYLMSDEAMMIVGIALLE